MGRKLLYIAASLLLVFASADATSRTSTNKIQIVYEPQENGDYRLFLFGSNRTLVCEEKRLRIVQDGDAINPVVIECKH